MSAVRVVLVEDDPAICDVVALIFSTEPGYEVSAAVSTAEAAIEVCRAVRPDLVLLDQNLAGPMTGVMAAPALRAAAPDAAIVLCTALDLADVARKESAIDGFVRKDQLAELVDLVEPWLAARGLPCG